MYSKKAAPLLLPVLLFLTFVCHAAPPVPGPSVWLTADQGVVLDGSGGVERWEDRSGNGNHFLQPIADKRPQVKVDGFVKNGGDLVLLQKGENGSATWGGTLGTPFIVDENVVVTHLAAFDHLRDGIKGLVTIQIRQRDDGGTELTSQDDGEGPIIASLTFDTANSGVLEDEWRWKPLGAPLTLVPGAYILTAIGYTGNDLFYEHNSRSRGPTATGVRWAGEGLYSQQNEPGIFPYVVGSAIGRYAGSGNMRYKLASAVRSSTPAVVFDGANDGLLAIDSLNIGRPSTVLVAYQREKDSFGYIVQNTTGNQWSIRTDGFYAIQDVRNFVQAWETPRVAGMVNTEVGTRAFRDLDDVTNELRQTLTAANPGRLALGGGEGRSSGAVPVRIAELLVYDRELTPAELRQTQVYLGERHSMFRASVATPEILPIGDLGTGNVSVTLANLTTGAEMRYTLDGSEPDAGSALYTATLSVPRGTEVKARAFLAGSAPSGVASQFYGDAAADGLPISGAVMWSRGDRGVETDANGRVTKWQDLTGNGNDFRQPIQDLRPVASLAFETGGGVAVKTMYQDVGNYNYEGTLGTDFEVTQEISISELAAFDHRSDGINAPITVQIWTRDDRGTPLTPNDDLPGSLLGEVEFTSANPGILENGFRFKPLAAPLTLPPGQYSVLAWGFTGGNFYRNSSDGSWLAEGIRFINNSRAITTPGTWPTTIDSHPVKYNGAGNFRFRRAAVAAEKAAAVTFDGLDDGMIQPLTAGLARPSTVYIAYEQRENGYAIQNRQNGWWFIRYDGGYADGWVANLTLPKLEPLVAGMAFPTSGTRFFLNGQDFTQDPNRTTPVPGQLALGGGNGVNLDPMRGDIAEVVAFDRELTAAERFQVEHYLSTRYLSSALAPPAVAISPPGDFGTGNVLVSLELAVPGAEIRYTTDGSDPVAGSTLYSGAVSVPRGTEMKAAAFFGGVRGEIAAAFYGENGGADDLPVAGASMWLRADRGVTRDGGGFVSKWADLTGNGNHVLQGISEKRPMLKTGGTGDTSNNAIWVDDRNGASAWTGTLGEDFIVNAPLDITHLGAFDHLRDGFAGTITVQLWSRDDGGTTQTQSDDTAGSMLAELTFTSSAPGELSGALRFKQLPSVLTLAPGAYTVLAWGYTGNDLYVEGNYSRARQDERFQFSGVSRYSNSPAAWLVSLDNRQLDYNGAANFRVAPENAESVSPPAVVFDGVDDGLRGVASMNFDRPSTVLVAFEYTRNETGYVLENDAGNHWNIRKDGFYASSAVRTLTFEPTRSYLATMVNGEGFTRAFVDGEEVTFNSSAANAIPGRLSLGGGEGRSIDAAPVRISEVVVYDRTLDAAELELLQTTLGERYGIIMPKAAQPQISPPSGYGTGDVAVVITTATGGAEIRYTTDGSEPSVGSTLYAGSFNVPRGTRVRAIALAANQLASEVAEAIYGDAAAHPLPASDPGLWLRADTGLEFNENGGVRRWRDLSGNGRDVVQPLAEKAPELAMMSFGGAERAALEIPAGQTGSNAWSGWLGTDFVVESEVEITALGVFDNASDGIGGSLEARLHRLGDNGTPENAADDSSAEILATLMFTRANPGTLDGGMRYKPLATALTLAPGRYFIEGRGFTAPDLYDSADRYDETIGRGISYPGISRYSANNTTSEAIPGTRLNDNRYLATAGFKFRPAGVSGPGLNAVRFDGVDDGLLGPEDYLVGRPSTILMVYQQRNGTAGRLLQSGNGGNWLLGPHSNPQGYYAEGWVSQQQHRANSPSISIAVQDTDNSRYFYNGQDLTQNPNPLGNVGRIALGGGEGTYFQPTNADLVELIVYDRILTDGERQQMSAALAARYGLAAEKLLPPRSMPAGGLFSDAQSVTLSHPVAGVEIRYTLDGSEPNQSSTLYSMPFVVSANLTVKARAYLAGFAPGDARDFAFFIDGAISAPPQRESMLLWLRAGVGTEGTSAVNRWRDLSGSGADATQATAAAQPTLDPTFVGGAPAVVFDGTDDFLQLPEGFANFSQGLTAMFVVRSTAVNRWERFLDLGRGASNSQIFFGRSSISNDFVYSVGGLSAPGALLPLSNTIFTISHTPDGIEKVFVNGSLITEKVGVALPATILKTSNLIGKSNFSSDQTFAGGMSEMVLYNTALGDLERETFEQTISARYGIASTSAGTVAFSPNPAQLYPSGVDVTLESVTADAEIRYTLDGSTPTETSALYTAPISLTNSTRIRARAFADGFNASQFSAATYLIGQPASSGDGLLATYFDNADFTGASLTRVDPTIDFEFGSGSPDPSIGSDTFSARWTGKMIPRFSENYTFSGFHDDGMRVWIDLNRNGTFEDESELVIDDYTPGRRETNSAPITLQAGLLYNLKVEFYENTSSAAARLSWASFSEPKTVVPQSQLFSDAPFSQTVSSPVISPAGGTFNAAVEVSITTATTDSTIYYTTDNSIPTTASTPYAGPFAIAATTTVRARAFKAGFNPSGTAASVFTIDAQPPTITDFAWNGVPIADGEMFVRKGTMSAIATDNQGVARAEFYYQPAGSNSRILIGSDTSPGNGLSTVWNVAGVSDGAYQVIVRVFDTSGVYSDLVKNVNVGLAAPTAPLIASPIDGISIQSPTVPVSIQAESNANVRVFRDGVLVFSGYASNTGVLNFSASIATGTNILKAVARNRAGNSPDSNSVSVTRVREFPQIALTFDANTVTEGSSVTGTVTIPAPSATAVSIQITNSRPDRIESVPPVVIAAGATSATFPLRARADSIIQLLPTITVTAKAPEYRSATASLFLADSPYPMIGLELDLASVRENAGSVSGRVTLETSRSLSLRVYLTNSLPTKVSVPNFVTIPGGQTSMMFTAIIIDNAVSDGNQIAQIGAEVRVETTAVSSAGPVPLEILDDDGPSLSLTAPKPLLNQGGSMNLTLKRNGGDPASALTVTFSQTPASQVNLPTSATFSANVTQISIPVSAPSSPGGNGTNPVTLRAAASGFNDALLELSISDENKPDLAPRALVAPALVLTESQVSVDYRVENYGPVPTSRNFFERVFLSKDTALSGDDILVRQVEQSGTIAANGGYGRSVTIFAPREVGDYYLIVTVDPGNDIDEINETNNTTVLLTPLQVRAAYTATVSTETTVIPTNNPVMLTGNATLINGQPAASVMVNIHISLGETKRVIAAITNSAGDFTATFRPLPNEGGIYTIGASHPGTTSAPEQDTFEILTMGFDPPAPLRLDEGETVVANAVVRNPNARDLTGLTISVGNLPAGLSISPQVGTTTVPAFGEVTVPLTISASSGFSGNGNFQLTANTTEGVVMSTGIGIRVDLLRPVMTLDPTSLASSALRGESSTVSFKVTNTGGLATGPIQVLLPDISWISLVSANPVASLAPGESADISLQLSPDATVPLTLYSGNLALNAGAGGTKSVPYKFRVVTDLRGDLTVDVVDELFYFTEAAPKLAGALVTVRDAITSEQVAEAVTDETGTVHFPNLMEGWYRIGITAERHDSYSNNYYVNAGTDNALRAFISKQLVNYSWTVQEVEIEDTYRITVETTFETNVPAPVVTISPGVIDVADLTQLGQTKVVNLTLTNQGFIAAQQSEFNFSEHPFYTFTPLVKNVGTIPAKSSLVVPVTIQRIGIFDENGDVVLLNPGRSARGGAGSVTRMPRAGLSIPCGAGGSLKYSYPCGPELVDKSASIAVSHVVGNCGGGPGGGGGYIGFHGGYFNRGAGSPGGTGTSKGGPGISFPSLDVCDPCIAMALLDCAIGLIPGAGCPFGAGKCLGRAGDAIFGSGDKVDALKDCLNAVGGCAADFVAKSIPIFGQIVSAIQCIDGLASCKAGAPSAGPGAPGAPGSPGNPPPFGPPWGRSSVRDGFDDLVFPLGQPWLSILSAESRQYASETASKLARMETYLDVYGVIYGTQNRALSTLGEDGAIWDDRFTDYRSKTSDGGYRISPDEAADLQAFASPLDQVAQTNLALVVERWNRSLDYGERGIYEIADVPDGESTDFIPDSRLKDAANRLVVAYEASQELGFSDPFEAGLKSIQEFKEAVAAGDRGVCSRVKIEISQDLVLTRTAFEATLTLENARDDEEVSEVGFDLQVRTASGEPAEDLFNIRVTRLDNLAAIDGTGELPASTSGTVQWTLIPRDTAALTEERQYTVGGVIHFVQDGTTFNIPVENVPITVRPDASLSLKYFHQRDVFSDDPFTDIVEPAIPYKLAVMVENSGFGAARDLKIISGQPKIVENEKGLFIDFKIIGTEVDGENVSPSLTAEFGELAPGQTKIATFLMTSTLQGLFIDYKATFEHVTGLGDERISLLKNVEIHEMIRMVRDQSPGADTAPDFLVNDVPDINDYPDTIHYSSGGTDVVTVRETGTFTGTLGPENLSIQLDVGAFSGWSYIRLPDPGAGSYQLLSVTRADGRVLPLDFNAWQTDRTFIGMGRRPRYEQVVHLADRDSGGVYTLKYASLGPLDSTPPTSLVTAFAGDSPAEIPVFWSGTDNQAVVFYDIYVSTNGGPYSLWKSKIRETGAMYPGTPGETYSFYSVAYDNAGNKESKGAVAEATTTAQNNNAPPVFATIPNQTIREGDIFGLTARATDPDGNHGDIRYSVGSTQTGIVIDRVTGRISWTTGEMDGGKTVTVVVVATDGGVPPAVANQSFTITVEDVNQVPFVRAIRPQSVKAGGVLIVDVDAVDSDFPLQTLTYSLAEAPQGAAIDPVTGVITWSPTSAQAGRSHVFKVAATDNGVPALTGVGTFSATVAGQATSGPVFTSVPVVLWTKGRSYSLNVTATVAGGDPITLTANLGNAPGAIFADQGGGVGQLDWNLATTEKGVYQVPVSATANNLTANATVRIRVENDELYWTWAKDIFGAQPAGFDLNLLDMGSDPDGDGRTNIHEMAFLTNPLAKDEVPLRIEVEREDPFATVRLGFKRRKGSQAYVNFGASRSATLVDAWEKVPSMDMTSRITDRGNIEDVEFSIFEYHEGGLPAGFFYRVESTAKPIK